MEYVIYLSKAKIDMMHEQLAKKSSNYSIGGEIDLKFFKCSATQSSTSDKTYYQKLEQVISAIETVNTIYDENSKYITGEMPMYWGILNKTPDATFWVGKEINNKCSSKVLLIGSSKHIIGNNPNGEGRHCSPLVYFMHAYAKELELDVELNNIVKLHRESNMHYIVDTMSEYYQNNEDHILPRYKFFAKCLSQSYIERSDSTVENLIIASPLYVSAI